MNQRQAVLRVIFLTAVSMIAFASNSVLARLALGEGNFPPLDYAAIRLLTGALVLAGFVYLRAEPRLALKGSWSGAASLFIYAVLFSAAYVLLSTGTGALILFASVQIGMLVWAVLKGERPSALEWLGIVVALVSLVFLVSPGLTAPPLGGSLLMVAAGLGWAAYTLIGHSSTSAGADTAGNFLRCAPFCVVLLAIGGLSAAFAWPGVVYGMLSGAIASGLGYVVWYSVLPSLRRSHAAFVQLSVPAIAAAGGTLFIGEPITARLILSSAGILGGIAFALLAANRRRTARFRGR